MANDPGTPICTWAEFTRGAFRDLARAYTDPTEQQDLLLEATRMCEDECDRRLAPFTLTESHRAQGIDPDEYTDTANLPMDLAGTVGQSYASSLGAQSLVRHTWLDQYAPRYPDMWTYSDVSVQIIRSYGGSQLLTAANMIGPEPDSGHLWFNLGLFLPVASWVRITYSGGYTTMPANLRRAGMLMTASLLVRELAPGPRTPDPEILVKGAVRVLRAYKRGRDDDDR